MKRVVIVGSEGQDGRLLWDRLERTGHVLLGIGRESIRSTDHYDGTSVDITSAAELFELVRLWRPNEIYYLAAFHHSSQDPLEPDSLGLFQNSFDVHVRGIINFLDAVRKLELQTRVFYAASCLIFGQTGNESQDENTPFFPRCPYGITKVTGVHCCQFYRNSCGVFAAVGILYNHESEYRRPNFLSRKIVRTVAKILRGEMGELTLGDLSASIDWGYAPDFVDAMERILALPEPEDFIIATGELHTVREFAEIAFGYAGLDWRQHVREDKSLITRQRPHLLGNASKLRKKTAWQPSVSFRQMVEFLVQSELNVP